MEDATGSEAEGKRMEDTADFGTEGGKMRGNTGSEIEIENMKESASLSGDSDFTWSRWYFPNITTDAGLRELDAYFMDIYDTRSQDGITREITAFPMRS